MAETGLTRQIEEVIHYQANIPFGFCKFITMLYKERETQPSTKHHKKALLIAGSKYILQLRVASEEDEDDDFNTRQKEKRFYTR